MPALLLYLMLWVGTSSFSSPPENTGRLVIEIDNVKSPEGIIWIGIYDPSNYMIKEKAIIEGLDVKSIGLVSMDIPSLAFGTYAIALFHDINGNGELDQNFIGVPTEPFAFSQIPKSKWRLPKFEEIQFQFDQNGQVIHTRLKRWWEKK